MLTIGKMNQSHVKKAVPPKCKIKSKIIRFSASAELLVTSNNSVLLKSLHLNFYNGTFELKVSNVKHSVHNADKILFFFIQINVKHNNWYKYEQTNYVLDTIYCAKLAEFTSCL